jgi:hypothetical protein
LKAFNLESLIFNLESPLADWLASYLIHHLHFNILPPIGSGSSQRADAVDDPPTTTDNPPGVLWRAAYLDAQAAPILLGLHLKLFRLADQLLDNKGDKLERHKL